MGDRRKERNERRRQKKKSRGKERREGTRHPLVVSQLSPGDCSHLCVSSSL